MKITYFRLVLLALFVGNLLLVACGGGETAEPPAATQPPANTAVPAATETEKGFTASATSTTTPPTAVPTNTPLPTAVPAAEAELIAYTDPNSLFALQYPGNWTIDETFGLILASDAAIIENVQNLAQGGAVVVVLAANAADFTGSQTAVTPMDVANAYLQTSLDGGEILEGPTETTINGQEAAVATAKGTSGDTEFLSYLTAIVSNGNAVLFMASNRIQDEALYLPTLQAMANSIVITTSAETVSPVVQNPAIAYGDTVQGEIGESGIALWSFSAQANEVIAVHEIAADGSSLDAILDVVDANGDSLLPDGAVDRAVSEEFIPALLIPADGVYTIAVSGYQGSTGAFSVSLDLADSEFPSTFVFVNAELTTADETDAYLFNSLHSAEHTVVRLIVEPIDPVDLTIDVYEVGNGTPLMTLDNSYTMEIAYFGVPADGTYYFAVRGYEGATGRYRATLIGPEFTTFEVTTGDVVVGRYGAFGVYEYYFGGADGYSINFVASTGDSPDLAIELKDGDGNMLATADVYAEGGSETLTYTFTDEAVYLLRVRELAQGANTFLMFVEEAR